MIEVMDKTFFLHTESTSYIFRVTENGHVEHLFYGNKVSSGDETILSKKNTFVQGSAVDYTPETPGYCLDNLLLEYSGVGKGDYRHSPVEIIMPDGSFITDFVYQSHSITHQPYSTKELPTAYGDGETLTITLGDKKFSKILLHLNYTVFEKSNVICRNVEIHNNCHGEITIRKLMSFMMDIPAGQYDLITFDGAWAKEAHLHRRPVEYGILVNDSTVGASSNRHNPGFLLAERNAREETGRVFGFNLIYSGNHYSAVEKGCFDTVRIMSGINPFCFLWKLSEGENFVTPQAFMTMGNGGFNSVMENFHSFINNNIVRGEYKNRPRPIVANNWEATFFNFTKGKIRSMAKKAQQLGVEMFVLDDGWFGERNSDKAGLGDWTVNLKKLPGGIKALAKEINKMGMKFGLWFEPECVNEDSDLYRNHPQWVIRGEDRQASVGRNQYVLDLTRSEVRDYIVDSVCSVLEECAVDYVKWDYNRHISDMFSSTLTNQGEFFHKYILGLYDVLERIFHQRHPKVLLESCSSGGNRFDAGMLCFSPQIWTSDNTDPMERLEIQGGIYCLYPQSTVSAHVSMAPHQQTLRNTPLSTRFNVSAFGVLGYELDFSELTPDECKQIEKQIAFYKEYRNIFQYGKLKKVACHKSNQTSWQLYDDGKIIAGLFQTMAPACDGDDNLSVPYADSHKVYTVKSLQQWLKISRFGSLIKHITPVPLRSDGIVIRTVDKHYSLPDGHEEYECTGAALMGGISPAMQYAGTGYNENLRILGDFGSNIYIIEEKP